MKFKESVNATCRSSIFVAEQITVRSSAYAYIEALGELKVSRSLLIRIFQSKGDKGLPCGQPLDRFLEYSIVCVFMLMHVIQNDIPVSTVESTGKINRYERSQFILFSVKFSP
ncbi:hypothetical protein SSS_02785 [Sarcoptes scabiei]|uniref:Uncharacterized protein n=1 Tax=Sarcoptes scabiei TaxID=52283 RepID=A0A834RFD0_SARSC|nr:hypothetical protein SSS_02785 [Sarcoptes scabiei]